MTKKVDIISESKKILKVIEEQQASIEDCCSLILKLENDLKEARNMKKEEEARLTSAKNDLKKVLDL